MFTQLIGTGLIFSGIVDTGGGGGGDDTLTGGLLMYAGSSAPSGYLLCNGSNVSQVTYAALFAIIGHSYDNASTTAGNFGLPDFRTRFPIGPGSSGDTTIFPGSTNGANFPHSHVMPSLFVNYGPPDLMDSGDVNLQNVTASQNHGHSNSFPPSFTDTANPPYLSLNFIIKV